MVKQTKTKVKTVKMTVEINKTKSDNLITIYKDGVQVTYNKGRTTLTLLKRKEGFEVHFDFPLRILSKGETHKQTSITRTKNNRRHIVMGMTDETVAAIGAAYNAWYESKSQTWVHDGTSPKSKK